MKIGQFITAVQTTKDTVRHYESLNLLQPAWENNRRIYSEKEIDNFLVIKELQEMRLSLNEIQSIFELKRQNGCGNNELINSVLTTLKEKMLELEKEEKKIRQRKEQINEIIVALYGDSPPEVKS